jgi:ParB family chromosome partitioning protein
VVKQRLRLAAVSEKLLDVYSEDGMSLDQLMAFTVTSDHARQEQVWEPLQRSYSQEPYQIRRMLTERTVRASDKRALFVGLDAYEQAGGLVMRDLFQQDDGGWLENVGLLDGLVAEKLKAEAEKIAAEGWKWIEVNVDFPFGHTHHLRELDGTSTDLTAQEQATIDALNAEYAKLAAEYEDVDELQTSWTCASAKSRRRSPPSRIGRSPTILAIPSSKTLARLRWANPISPVSASISRLA